MTSESQEQMTTYYNTAHVWSNLKLRDFVKLSIKNLKLKCWKLSSCWIESVQSAWVYWWQIYRLALPNKYS
jgi:hypothetical protein